VSGRVRLCISELESLAITPKRLNDLNDAYEMEELVDDIKFNLYQEYKSEQSDRKGSGYKVYCVRSTHSRKLGNRCA
jgi:hypothetical protein